MSKTMRTLGSLSLIATVIAISEAGESERSKQLEEGVPAQAGSKRERRSKNLKALRKKNPFPEKDEQRCRLD